MIFQIRKTIIFGPSQTLFLCSSKKREIRRLERILKTLDFSERSAMASRENLVFIAKLAERAERFDGKPFSHSILSLCACVCDFFFFFSSVEVISEI